MLTFGAPLPRPAGDSLVMALDLTSDLLHGSSPGGKSLQLQGHLLPEAFLEGFNLKGAPAPAPAVTP